MLVSYKISGRTSDERLIHGHALIQSTPDLTSGVRYDIVAVQIACDDLSMCKCGTAGALVFPDGPQPKLVRTGNADWMLDVWANAGTGAWFFHADGTPYPEPMPLHGDKMAYKTLAPCVKLNTDLVQTGPFQPAGDLHLSLCGCPVV